MSNQLPQMPIRAKYADKTAEGVNIDEALSNVGTRLYIHTIVDSTNDYIFKLITTSQTPLNFTTLDTQSKLKLYLQTIVFISFVNEYNQLMAFSVENACYYAMTPEGSNDYSDWDLTKTTDTVTPL